MSGSRTRVFTAAVQSNCLDELDGKHDLGWTQRLEDCIESPDCQTQSGMQLDALCADCYHRSSGEEAAGWIQQNNEQQEGGRLEVWGWGGGGGEG